MRLIARSPLLWTIVIVTATTFLTPLTFSSCRHSGEDKGLDTVAVNPRFATNPPIAEDVSVQLLQKPDSRGNILIKASFAKDRIGSPYLAFMADDRKIVLRDDGVEPDENKGDNVYTAIAQLNLEDLQRSQALMGTGN